MGVQRGPSVITDGLVACWDFSSKACYGGSGSTCSDLVGKNVGTISTPTFVSNGAKSAFVFDASNTATINIQDTPSLNFGTGDFSVEAWFYVTACASGGSSNNYPCVFISDSNGLAYDNARGTTNPFTASVLVWNGSQAFSRAYTPELPLNTWHHVVGTSTGSASSDTGKNIYANGEGPYTGTGNGNWLTPTEFQIGRGYTANYVDGSIGLIRVYNRALTFSEVKSNYIQSKGRFQ